MQEEIKKAIQEEKGELKLTYAELAEACFKIERDITNYNLIIHRDNLRQDIIDIRGRLDDLYIQLERD